MKKRQQEYQYTFFFPNGTRNTGIGYYKYAGGAAWCGNLLGKCKAKLENGNRIITQKGVFTALDRPVRGNTRVINVPSFLDANNLQPFVGEDLEGVLNQIDFLDKNGNAKPDNYHKIRSSSFCADTGIEI
jgi:hypothetical protein